MIRFLTSVILTLAATIIAYSNNSAPQTINFQQVIKPSEIDGDDPIYEKPGNGHRMPPAPIFCELNFDVSTISSSSHLLDNIIDYQIFNENGDACLATAPEAEHLFDALKQMPSGTYVLKFITT